MKEITIKMVFKRQKYALKQKNLDFYGLVLKKSSGLVLQCVYYSMEKFSYLDLFHEIFPSISAIILKLIHF